MNLGAISAKGGFRPRPKKTDAPAKCRRAVADEALERNGVKVKREAVANARSQRPPSGGEKRQN